MRDSIKWEGMVLPFCCPLSSKQRIFNDYESNWGSPLDRANHATRHIFNVYKRKLERNRLLDIFMAEQVVQIKRPCKKQLPPSRKNQ